MDTWTIIAIVCLVAVLIAVVVQLVEDAEMSIEPGVSIDFFHDIDSGEIRLTQAAIEALSEVNQCTELVERFRSADSFRDPENRNYMFEARFAYELLSVGADFKYEYAAGVGNSTIDFKTASDPTWCVELVGGRLSEKAWDATEVQDHGGITTASQEMDDTHETWRLINLIISKASKNGQPWKFPSPTRGTYHMILVDVRSYLHTADCVDYKEIVYGVRGLPKGWPVELVKSNPKNNRPIGGLFDDTNTTAGAEYLRARVHFVVFVREQKYTAGEISSRLMPFPNWKFFTDQSTAQAAFDTFPLRAWSMLNRTGAP